MAQAISIGSPRVWVASGWFRDNEPFFTMVFDPARFNAMRAKKRFLSALRKEAREMWRGGDWGMTQSEFLDDLAWSGLHMESLSNLISPRLAESHEIIDDLRRFGAAYIPTGG